ncbi:MAG TPA: cyclic nucleotide-binding domain-containing protein [Gaiellaceae bacterium]|nr:cyclic nucleotide-binding domain-containing protein [Gaiellaceae bacterium]
MSPLRRRLAAAALAGRNANVRRVQLAWGTAITAEWAYFVALGVFAYDAGGASAVGLAGLVRLLPAAFVAPSAASLGDRVRRERLLLGAALLGTVSLAGSALAALADSETGVFAGAAFFGISSTLIRPTLQALLPSLTRTPEELVSANAATSTVESLGTLIGPLVAGVLVGEARVGVTFAAAAGAMAVGVCLILLVHAEGSAPARAARFPPPSVAWRTVVQRPGAPVVVFLMVAQAFVRGCLNVLIVVAAFRLLGGAGGTVGVLTAAIGAGGVVGAVVSSTIHGSRLARVFALSLLGWGLPIALIAPSAQLVAAFLLLAVVGASNSFEDVSGFTLLQRAIRDDALSGVLGLIWGAAMGALALGSIATPTLVRIVGAHAAFVAVGFLLPVLTVAGYRRLRGLDAEAVPTRQQHLVDDVPIFAPLSLAAKERLAARLVPLEVAAGMPVVRAGEVGDRFYIVDSGSVRIAFEDGEKESGVGDYFGEIALLRDVPRTATVTASAETRLYALERADFLAAVTGHALAEAAADEVVSERLAGYAARA